LSKIDNISGQKFERLMVIEDSGKRRRGSVVWTCLCDCGKTIEAIGNELKNGRVLSCGCYHKDVIRKEKGIASLNRLFYSYKKRANLKGLEFELTKEYFKNIITEKCYYCGRSPKTIYIRKYMNGGTTFNGIDRIDNLKGYTQDNIVTCCSTCNYAKRSMSQKDFFEWINELYCNLKIKDLI